MDPHAAHERVLFEKFLAEVSCRHVASQPLLLPRTVELSRAEASRVRACLGLLKQMGFGISEFGGNAFVLDALPACFGDVAPEPMLTQIAAALEEGGQRAGETRWREETVARAACRSAVKARDRLTIEEVEKLVVELVRTEMPYTCPHGRPTLIFTSFRDLRRKFGRE
jgi:DNA mismatch repair protein MutL